MCAEHPLFDAYWEQKVSKLERSGPGFESCVILPFISTIEG